MFKMILSDKEIGIKVNLKKLDASEVTLMIKRVNSCIEIAK